MNRTLMAVFLACVAAGLAGGGCANHKKNKSKVPLDRGVTDIAPKKATPTSAVPPDPSYVYVPASATQPKFVPVDVPAQAPVPAPVIARAPLPAPATEAAAPATLPPVVTQTPVAPASPAPASGYGSRQYRVIRGDTLFRIAKTHYGDGNRWQQIASANPGLTPASLKAGSTIVVP
jgi:5'-nucleotidase